MWPVGFLLSVSHQSHPLLANEESTALLVLWLSPSCSSSCSLLEEVSSYLTVLFESASYPYGKPFSLYMTQSSRKVLEAIIWKFLLTKSSDLSSAYVRRHANQECQLSTKAHYLSSILWQMIPSRKRQICFKKFTMSLGAWGRGM